MSAPQIKAIEIEFAQDGQSHTLCCHNTVAEMSYCMNYIKQNFQVDHQELIIRDVYVTEQVFYQKAWNKATLQKFDHAQL